jgi:hypothetical protein
MNPLAFGKDHMDEMLDQPERPPLAEKRGRLLRGLETFVDGAIFCLRKSRQLAAELYGAAREWSRALRAVGWAVLAMGSILGAVTAITRYL